MIGQEKCDLLIQVTA